jgi:hypothetical protein
VGLPDLLVVLVLLVVVAGAGGSGAGARLDWGAGKPCWCWCRHKEGSKEGSKQATSPKVCGRESQCRSVHAAQVEAQSSVEAQCYDLHWQQCVREATHFVCRAGQVFTGLG